MRSCPHRNRKAFILCALHEFYSTFCGDVGYVQVPSKSDFIDESDDVTYALDLTPARADKGVRGEIIYIKSRTVVEALFLRVDYKNAFIAAF